jgi:hypothetical protein
MEKKDSVSWKFYALLGTATIGVVGGLYYLYNLFSSNYEMEISEEQKTKIDELTTLYQNISESSESSSSSQKANSEKDFTIKVFKQINEFSEEMFKKEHPNWIQQRRQILEKSGGSPSSSSEYTSFCENILAEKMRIESTAAELVLQKLGMNQFDLQAMMERIPQQDFMALQEEIMKKQALGSDSVDVAKVSNDAIIKAFKSFLVKKKQLDEETKNLAQFMNDTSEEARMNFFLKLEIHKYMIDDFLFNSYGFDFNMLLQLLTDRKLTTHKEIERDYNNLLYELRQSFQ